MLKVGVLRPGRVALLFCAVVVFKFFYLMSINFIVGRRGGEGEREDPSLFRRLELLPDATGAQCSRPSAGPCGRRRSAPSRCPPPRGSGLLVGREVPGLRGLLPLHLPSHLRLRRGVSWQFSPHILSRAQNPF